nr:hypothetical protein [Tanacetum cinerariifolium]
DQCGNTTRLHVEAVAVEHDADDRAKHDERQEAGNDRVDQTLFDIDGFDRSRHGYTFATRDDPVGVDTQDRRHLAVLLGGAAHATQLGVLDDVGQHAHADERGNQDEDLGVRDLYETAADLEAHGAFEQGRNALLAWALGDL